MKTLVKEHENLKDRLHLKVELFMKENGLTDRETDKEINNGLMGLDTKDSGKMERQMVMVNLITQMATYTKEIGSMIRRTAMEFTTMRMVLSMLDSGKTINSMALD